jgi:hypothetical protein
LKYHYTPRDEDHHHEDEEDEEGHEGRPIKHNHINGDEDEEEFHWEMDEDEEGAGQVNGHDAEGPVEIPMKPDSIAYARSQRMQESERAKRERRRRRRKCIRLMGPLGRLLSSRKEKKCEQQTPKQSAGKIKFFKGIKEN